MTAPRPEPQTEAGRRLLADFPANAADAASPEFIRRMVAGILAIEAEAVGELGREYVELQRRFIAFGDEVGREREDRLREGGAVSAAEERLELARRALVDTGYFTEEQVGPDVAPRITELHSALDTGAVGAAAEPFEIDRDTLIRALIVLLDQRENESFVVTKRDCERAWARHKSPVLRVTNGTGGDYFTISLAAATPPDAEVGT